MILHFESHAQQILAQFRNVASVLNACTTLHKKHIVFADQGTLAIQKKGVIQQISKKMTKMGMDIVLALISN